MKENNSYKYYIFYADGDKYVPLNTCFSKREAGYYNDYVDEGGKYGGNVSKTMNFVISDDDLIDRINNIFKHIEEKLDIALQECFYQSEMNCYVKIKVKDAKIIILYQIKILNMNANHYYKYSLFILRKIKNIFSIILKYD